MTSHFQREDERSLFTPETPHFFKIILDETISVGKLRIPGNFVEKYGRGMRSQVILEVPSGAVWKVELSKSDGKIWFGKGWQEFAEYYSLRRGHFLVFRYDQRKNGQFHVLIFDMTSASEIDYRNFTKLADKHIEDDVSVEILEEISPCKKKTREKSAIQTQYPRPLKKMKIELENLNEHANSSGSKQRFTGLKPSEVTPTKGMDNNGRECQEQARDQILGFEKLTAKEKAKALEIANAFKSENPFYLTVMNRLSYINHPYYVGIPTKFARKYLKETVKGRVLEAILCLDSDGKTWSVRYTNTYCTGNTRARFFWKEFVLDNNIEAGDVCVFELLKLKPKPAIDNIVSFQVVIHRNIVNHAKYCYPTQQCATESSTRARVLESKGKVVIDLESESDDSSRCKKPGNNNVFGGDESGSFTNMEFVTPKGIMDRLKSRKGPAADAEVGQDEDFSTMFASKHPYFKRTMMSSYLSHSCTVDVPYDFLEKHFEPNVSQVMLQVADKVWPVKVNSYVYPKIGVRNRKFSAGWSKFAKENSLKQGDICVFELIDSRKAILKVSIFTCGHS